MPRTKTPQAKREEPIKIAGAVAEIDAEVPLIDDKIDADSPLAEAEESEELAPEEAVLDDEELNPFGDKWEE